MIGVTSREARLLKPAVLVGSMVQNQVEDDMDAAFVGFSEQAVKILQVPEFGIDGVVIRNIIAEVDIRRRINGGEPNAVDAELPQVVEVLDDACQITDTVRITVLKGTRVNLVDNAIFPP